MGQRTATATTLLHQPFFRPLVNVQAVEQITGLSYANADTLIGDFESLELLKEITGQKRNRRYACAPYLSLLTEGNFREPLSQHAFWFATLWLVRCAGEEVVIDTLCARSVVRVQ